MAPPSISVKDALARAKEYILKSSSGGSWGYHPASEPSTEATAWCAIALRGEHNQARTAASDYLLKTQNKDGGWSTAYGAGNSDWSSGPALLALRIFANDNYGSQIPIKTQSALAGGLNYLFDSRSDPNPPVARLLLLLIKGTGGLNYGRGWPWTPHCWNWVEPSSYNLLALKLPRRPEVETFDKVIDHVHRYFIDHACSGGGWNHGANRSLGKNLPAYPVTTAEALLALQDMGDNPVVKSGLAFLEASSGQDNSAMSLAWSILARDAHKLKTQTETTALLKSQKVDGSFGSNLMVTALAVTALKAANGENALIITK